MDQREGANHKQKREDPKTRPVTVAALAVPEGCCWSQLAQSVIGFRKDGRKVLRDTIGGLGSEDIIVEVGHTDRDPLFVVSTLPPSMHEQTEHGAGAA